MSRKKRSGKVSRQIRSAAVLVLAALLLIALWWASLRLGKIYQGDRKTTGTEGQTEFARDTDNDGVADGYETSFYATDPNKADTDGDGVSDLDEILAGSDPLTVGAGAPALLTGKAAAPEANFTQRYLASLPKDWPREKILDQARLEEFIEANKGKLLPEISISPAAAGNNEVTKTYLSQISSAGNPNIKPATSDDIATAFLTQVRQQNYAPMETIVANLQNNLAELRKISPPSKTAELHQKLLAAAESLLANTERLRTINDDFVGGLIGAKNIEELGEVFREISAEIQAFRQ